MSHPSVTDEEVEAAARAIEPDAFEDGCACENCEKWRRSACAAARIQARAALEAAAQVRERKNLVQDGAVSSCHHPESGAKS